MKESGRLVSIILAAALAVAVVGLWQYKREVSSLQAAAALLRENAQASRLKVAELTLRLNEAEAARARAEQVLQNAAVKPGANSPGPRIAPGELARQDPAFAAYWRTQLRRSILRQYGDWLSLLNLPPEKLARLKELLVEQTVSPIEARDAASQAGLGGNSAALAQAAEQEAREVTQEITTLLGDQGAAQLEGIQHAGSLRFQVDAIGLDLGDAGLPLTPAQSEQLGEALYASGEEAKAHPDASGAGTGTSTLLDRATGILSPAQLEIMKRGFRENQAGMAAFNHALRAPAGP